MALVLADRVKDTTTTTGQGTVTLSGTAPTGFQNFSAIGNGNTTYYTIAGGSEWEVGIGTYTSSGTTLSRDTVLASSAGGTTKVTFSAGTKDVFVTYPAERSVNLNSSALTSGRVPYATTNGLLTDASGFTFSGTALTFPSPFTLGATSVTSTGTQLNYLNAATGTTGTTSTNLVFSASPTLTGTLTAAAATFSSAVTLTGSGASNAQVLTSTGATTGSIRYNLANTGGNAWLGIDSSAGGQLATSSTAYSTVFGSVGATSLHLITSDIVRFTINSAGAVTNAGSLTQTGAFTYGGVTLSNSVTGTGSMVLSAAPTLTGNLTLGSTNSSILQGTGGTGATTPTIQMNGGSASDGGVYIRFARNSVVKGYIGTASAVIGGTSDDIAVHSASALRLYAGSTQSLTVSAAGAVQFNVGYGAGTITSDASGNLTSVSDPAEKDFVAPYKPGLPQILAIARNDKFMGLHRWRKDNRSNQETEGVYASFFAHDDFPLADAVHKGTNGINSFSDRPVVMALVNAVAELKAEIATLKSKVN